MSIINDSNKLGSGGQNLVLETAGKVYIKVKDRFYELDFRNQGKGGTTIVNNNTEESPEVDLSEYVTKNDLVGTLDDYVTKRNWNDVKETQALLEQALLDGFSERINPISIDTMQLIVGSKQLQFEFIESITDGTPKSHTLYIDEIGRLVCPEGVIQHYTIDGPDAVQPEKSLKQYCRWTVQSNTNTDPSDHNTYIDLPVDEQAYYLYIVANKINYTQEAVDAPDDETSRTGIYAKTGNATFMISETAYSLHPEGDDSTYYFLYAIINSKSDGERSISTLNGFTEILPGQVTAYIFKSPDGVQYIDFQNKSFNVGDNPTSPNAEAYVHYDVVNGLSIKGKITVTGGELQDTLDNLQAQIDDEVQAWFSSDAKDSSGQPITQFLPSPLESNPTATPNWPITGDNEHPAWSTDVLKKEHAGDLYYVSAGTTEQGKGRAFRYVKGIINSVERYYWIEVADVAIIEALKAAREAKEAAQEAQEQATEALEAATDLNEYVLQTLSDGVLTQTEKDNISNYYKTLQAEYADLDASYDALVNNDGVSTAAKNALTAAWGTLSTNYTTLINATTAILNHSITPVGTTSEEIKTLGTAFETAFTSFKTALDDYKIKAEAARQSVTDNFRTQLEEFNYLKTAIQEGQTTIAGGLVLTNTLVLNDVNAETATITAGINGNLHPGGTYKPDAIAAWFGGNLKDKKDYYNYKTDHTWELKPGITDPGDIAKTVFRHDGTGYLANGNIVWDENGNGSVAGGLITWDGSNVQLATGISVGGSQTLGSILNAINAFASFFSEETYVESGVTKHRLKVNDKFECFYSNKEIAAGGVGSGTPTPGATTLGGLLNVTDSADEVQSADKILVRLANASGGNSWTLANLSDISGTVVGVRMNGTVKNPGIDKIVDLGTVLTEHQSLAGYQPLIDANHKLAYSLISDTPDLSDMATKTWVKGSIPALVTAGGRVYGSGDDEGIIISKASNGYAGLILGSPSGVRSVFYLSTGNPFWRYNNGTTSYDISHPAKSGTIALTSDVPTKLSDLTDDATHRLVTDSQITAWGNKYDKPSTGIPLADLANDVQTSLGKADTALQSSNIKTLTITKNTSVTCGTYNPIGASATTIDIPDVASAQTLSDLKTWIESMFEKDTTSVSGQTLIKAKFSLYSEGEITAGGVGSGGGGGTGALYNCADVTAYNNSMVGRDSTHPAQAGDLLAYDGTHWHAVVAPATGVTTFNNRSGAVTLSSFDVTTALEYTPVNKAGDTMSGTLTINRVTNNSAALLDVKDASSAGSDFHWAINATRENIAQGGHQIILVGRSSDTNNQSHFGFRYYADGSINNAATIGLYAKDDIVNIYADRTVTIGDATTAHGTYKLNVDGSLNANGQLRLSNSSSVAVVIDSTYSGTTPAYPVQYINGSRAAGTYSFYEMGAARSKNNTGYFGYYYAGSGSNNNFITLGFFNNDDLFTVWANTNVGIGCGTSAPSYRLDTRINSSSQYHAASFSNAASHCGVIVNSATNYNPFIDFRQAGTAKAEVGYATGGWIYLGSAGTATGILNVKLSTQNVGIGTTSPASSYKLDVNGALNATAIYQNGVALGARAFDNTAYLPISAGGSYPLTNDLYFTAGQHRILFENSGGTLSGYVAWTENEYGNYIELYNPITLKGIWIGDMDTTAPIFWDGSYQRKIYHSGNLTASVIAGLGILSNSITGNAATATNANYATSAGNADTVDSEHASAFAHRAIWNNLIHNGNEFTYASAGYNGVIWHNYRTASGSTDGNITDYYFGNGKGGSLVALSTLISQSSHGETAYNSLGNYLPLSGGTLSSGAEDPLRIKGNATNALIRYYKSDGTSLGYIGIHPGYGATYYDTAYRTIYHSGNANNASTPWSCSNLTASGNVGIGTTSSVYKLDVSQSVDGNFVAGVNNTGNINYQRNLILGNPNLSAGRALSCLALGTNASTNNLGEVGFYYAGNGSTSNLLGFGVWGYPFLMTVGSNGSNTTPRIGIGLQTTKASYPLHISAATGDGSPAIWVGSTSSVAWNYMFSGIAPSQSSGNNTIIDVGTGHGVGNAAIFGHHYVSSGNSANHAFIAMYGCNYLVNCFYSGNVTIGTQNNTDYGERLYVAGNLVASGEVTAGSDARWKDNQTPVLNGIDIIRQLRPMTWTWNEQFADKNYIGKQSAGLIAQQVASVLPFAVRGSEENGYTLDYNVFHAYEISAIQSHETEIEKLRKRVRELETRLYNIENM